MSKDTQDNNEEYVTVSLEYGPGQTLADGREAKGLTIADVATRLNVTETIVNGLERDDYTNLPPTIYTRGYLRNYANLLEIDPEPLLERHKQLTSTEDDEVTRPAAIQAETSGRMIKKNKFKRKKDRSTSLFIFLLVLMFIGIAYGIYAFVHKPSTNYPSSSAIEQQSQGGIEDTEQNNNLLDADESSISIPDEAKSQQLNLPESRSADDKQAELLSEDENSQTLSLSLPANSQITDSITSGQEDDESSEVTTPQIAMDLREQDVEEAAVSAHDRADSVSIEADIKLLVADDSYIEITDSTGKRFFFRVLTAGSVKNITGKRPFKVVLGNAGAVKLEYNGKPFDFGNYGLGKVARFSLQ